MSFFMGQAIDQSPVLEIETVPSETNESSGVAPNLEFNAVKRFFEMPMYLNSEESTKVQDIVKFLRNNNVTPREVNYELRRLERKLGGPTVGETRIGKIWRFLRLLDKSDIDKMARKEIKLYAKHIK